MTGFKIPRGRGHLTVPFAKAAAGVGIAALIILNAGEPEPDKVMTEPVVAAAVIEPAPETIIRHVAVAHALSIAEYAEGATQAEAQKAAGDACERLRLERYNKGNYTAGSCEQFLPLNNSFGPACGILLKNNIVGNIGAVWLAGPTQWDVQRAARKFLLREDPAVFNNRDNPYASAMQICVRPNGKVEYTNLSYELSR